MLARPPFLSERTEEMKKTRLLLISVLLALPVVGAGAAPAHACTSQFEPDGCAVINSACRKFFGGNCLG